MYTYIHLSIYIYIYIYIHIYQGSNGITGGSGVGVELAGRGGGLRLPHLPNPLPFCPYASTLLPTVGLRDHPLTN